MTMLRVIRRWFRAFGLTLFTLFLSSGCGTTQNDRVPSSRELYQAAQEFRSKEPTDRFIEAQKVYSLLPTCPVTFRQVTGSGVLTALDYSHPSYRLRKELLIKLLGEPDFAKPNSYTYIVNKHKNNTSTLIITFENDLVVEAMVSTYAD